MFEYSPVPKPTHKRKNKKRVDRGKFSKFTRDQIKEKFNNLCGICGSRACHVHHVMPRSRGGRNVFTNGLLLCNECHKKVHSDNELLKRWINEFKKNYGSNFYRDKEDLIFEYKTDQFNELGKEVEMWVKYNGEAY